MTNPKDVDDNLDVYREVQGKIVSFSNSRKNFNLAVNEMLDPGPHGSTVVLILATMVLLSIVAMVYCLISPLLIVWAMAQIFVDAKFWTMADIPIDAWRDMLKGIKSDDQKAAEATAANAKIKGVVLPDNLPPEQYVGKSYWKTLWWFEKNEFEKSESYYDPETDPCASHLKNKFEPHFEMPHDQQRYDAHKAKWTYLAQMTQMRWHLTKSRWDGGEANIISPIYFEPYTYKLAHASILVASPPAHGIMIECLSAAFYEIDYYLEMMQRAHDLSPILSDNAEFQIRYKVLRDSSLKLRDTHGALKRRIKSEKDEKAREIAAGPGIFDLIIGYKKAKLFMDQCEFFDKERKKK